MTTLAELRRGLAGLVDDRAFAGYAEDAADASSDAVRVITRTVLGGDSAMSGLGVRLDVDQDHDRAGVALDFVPAGAWVLAEDGRRNRATVRPIHRRAVITPAGPRAAARPGPARGLRAVTRAADAAADAVETALYDALERATDRMI